MLSETIEEWFENVVVAALAAVLVVVITAIPKGGSWDTIDSGLFLYVAGVGAWVSFKMMAVAPGAGARRLPRIALHFLGLAGVILGVTIGVQPGYLDPLPTVQRLAVDVTVVLGIWLVSLVATGVSRSARAEAGRAGLAFEAIVRLNDSLSESIGDFYDLRDRLQHRLDSTQESHDDILEAVADVTKLMAAVEGQVEAIDTLKIGLEQSIDNVVSAGGSLSEQLDIRENRLDGRMEETFVRTIANEEIARFLDSRS